jgi:hypothetical protein
MFSDARNIGFCAASGRDHKTGAAQHAIAIVTVRDLKDSGFSTALL